MRDKLQGPESTPAVTERRTCPRLRVTSLIYIDIGNVNGGIVTSVSEKGLALTAAATLDNAGLGDGPLGMQIQFPGAPETIQASGQIVWTSPSGKEACVHFVELGEETREQIRRWISDQISTNGLRQGPPKLPKMQLPSPRRAKARRSRFSFSEVASSPVDAEGEPGVEGLPEIAGEPSALPPLPVEAPSFRDGAEAVASAFESPAFTESQMQKAHLAGSEQGTRAILDDQLQPQPSPSIPERRQLPRRQILLFTYAVLGDDNGGLVFSLGEGGLALTAAAALQEHHFTKVRLRFPDSEDWIETSGRLAWKNDSGKEAGIAFLNLPEDVRARIREWVSQEEPANGAAGQSGVQELPHFMEPDGSPTEPFEIPASFQEESFENSAFGELPFEEPAVTPAPSPSALFRTGIKGILERASVRRRVAKIKPPELGADSVKPKTRLASKALNIAAGIALALGGWMFLQRSSTNEASGIIAQNTPNTQSSQEPIQKPGVAKTEAGAVGATADPRVQLRENTSENTSTQKSITKPSVQRTERESPLANPSKTGESVPTSGIETTPKQKPPSKEALAPKLPVSSLPRSSDQKQRPSPSKREQETKLPQIAASAPAPSSKNKLAENKLAEKKPVEIAQTLPAQNKLLNPTPRSLNSNPPQPTTPSPVDLEKEKPSITLKQPEPPVARTPVVTVSFDPYPSIRMPKAEKSKKSQQGKSLQMGRLVTRVDPVYPEEARQQGVEGTARVHAIFNRDGSVQSVVSLSGPPSLVPAAMSAVRQWRYSQTILGGQPMETEEDVTVLFRLANSATKN